MNRSTCRARAWAAVMTLAAAGLLSLPPAVASAATTPDTFSIRNLTRYPLVTTGVHVGGSQNWSSTFGDRFPYPGQVIKPGQIALWDLAWSYNGPAGTVNPTSATIDYTLGVAGPAIHIFAYQNDKGWPLHQTAYGCTSDTAAFSCPHDGHGADVLETAPADTVVPAGDPTRQAQLMTAMCQIGNPVMHCGFIGTPTLAKVTIPFKPLGDNQYNYTDETSEHSWTQAWDNGISMKIGGSYSPISIDVAEVVKVEVKVIVDHDWGTSHAASITNGVDVAPGHVGWIEAEIPALQLTGDLRVGVGNQWWTLQGATFTTPDLTSVAKTGVFDWTPRGQARSMTALEKAAAPPTS